MRHRFAFLLIVVLAVLGAALGVFAQDAPDAEAIQNDPNNPVFGNLIPLPEAVESGYAPVNDIQMYYAVYGPEDGQPVLLLHGGLGNADYFANQIPAFVDAGYRVITPDSRGHGRSSVTDTPIDYDLMSSDVLALMDYLGIEQADLVGWSDGGIIGLDIAIHNPERLHKLVAYAANYVPSGVMSDIGTDDVFNAYIAQAMLDYQLISPTPDRFDAFLANIGNMWATEPNWTQDELRAITVPTLFIDGWQEEAIYPAHDYEMSELVPGSTLILLPDVGHFAMFLTPELFNGYVLGYLGS
ncbi:MAG: alpha/beta fold hydrolase [Anaerolineae bacterium]